jgi:hypothetical protein
MSQPYRPPRYVTRISFSFFNVLCVGSGLTTGWSPVQGILQTVYKTIKLHTQGNTSRINVNRHPCLEWDSNPWPLAFEWAKTVHALYHAANVIGYDIMDFRIKTEANAVVNLQAKMLIQCPVWSRVLLHCTERKKGNFLRALYKSNWTRSLCRFVLSLHTRSLANEDTLGTEQAGLSETNAF